MARVEYNLVKGYLRTAGFTMAATAAELGITQRTLHNKIKGKSEFTLDEALKIKSMVGRSIEDIFLPSSVAN